MQEGLPERIKYLRWWSPSAHEDLDRPRDCYTPTKLAKLTYGTTRLFTSAKFLTAESSAVFVRFFKFQHATNGETSPVPKMSNQVYMLLYNGYGISRILWQRVPYLCTLSLEGNLLVANRWFDLIIACYSAAGGGLFASYGETDDDDKPNSFHGPEIESLLEEIGDLLGKSKVFAKHLTTGRPSKSLGGAGFDLPPPSSSELADTMVDLYCTSFGISTSCNARDNSQPWISTEQH
ncbi:Transcription factor [Penicillium sp. CMV-2018d]|nr:Transcription factor [Penicillium sp. CMV-2018d]